MSNVKIQRIIAGIKLVLAASRNFGHCFLTETQILVQVEELLQLNLGDRLPDLLHLMEKDNLLMVRNLMLETEAERCYYSKTLYFDELYVARKIGGMHPSPVIDKQRVEDWIAQYCQKVYPWSSLHYGISAVDVVRKLYTQWIPKYFGNNC